MVTISCRTRVANGRAQPRPTSTHGLAYELLFCGSVAGTRAESPLASPVTNAFGPVTSAATPKTTTSRTPNDYSEPESTAPQQRRIAAPIGGSGALSDKLAGHEA